MGAALLVSHGVLVKFEDWYIGLHLWEEALKLREQQPKIPKILHQPSNLLLFVLGEPTSEFQCIKELLLQTVYSGKMKEQA